MTAFLRQSRKSECKRRRPQTLDRSSSEKALPSELVEMKGLRPKGRSAQVGDRHDSRNQTRISRRSLVQGATGIALAAATEPFLNAAASVGDGPAIEGPG